MHSQSHTYLYATEEEQSAKHVITSFSTNWRAFLLYTSSLHTGTVHEVQVRIHHNGRPGRYSTLPVLTVRVPGNVCASTVPVVHDVCTSALAAGTHEPTHAPRAPANYDFGGQRKHPYDLYPFARHARQRTMHARSQRMTRSAEKNLCEQTNNYYLEKIDTAVAATRYVHTGRIE